MKRRKIKSVSGLREPSLKKMMIKYAARGFLFAVIFSLLVTWIFAEWQMNMSYDNYLNTWDNCYNNIENLKKNSYEVLAKQGEFYSYYKGTMLYNLKSVSLYHKDIAAAIVEKNEDSYTYTYDSKQAVLVRLKNDSEGEQKSFLSFCDFEENDNQREVKKLMSSNQYGIKMKSCYIGRGDSSKYQPGVVEVYRNIDQELYKTIDCTPDDTSGYEYYDLEKGPWHCGIQLCVGSSSDSASMVSLKENLADYLKDAKFEMETKDTVVFNDVGFCNLHFFKTSRIVTGNTVPILKGESNVLDIDENEYDNDEGGVIPLEDTVSSSSVGKTGKKQQLLPTDVGYLVMEIQFNLWEEFRGMLINTWLVTILFFLLVSLIAAGLRFHSCKLKWEKERYRISLMNTMAHDLKSPLMVLSGYAENLGEILTDAQPRQKYYIDSIMDNVKYMNTMIGDILELSKLEQLGEQGELIQLEIHTLVREVLERYQDIIVSKEIRTDITGEAVIEGEKRAMLRVVDNLINNAVSYTPRQEQIVITINDKYMEIRNTGVMVSEELCVNAFQPFVKGDDARSNGQGNGLGLSIVKEILDNYHMTCEMESKDNEVRVIVHFAKK